MICTANKNILNKEYTYNIHVPCYITENIGFYLLRKRRRYAPMWHVGCREQHVASSFRRAYGYGRNARVYLLAKYNHDDHDMPFITHTHAKRLLQCVLRFPHMDLIQRKNMLLFVGGAERDSKRESSALPQALCLCDLYTQESRISHDLFISDAILYG